MPGVLAEFSLTPAVPLWVLVPGVLVALGLSAVLYKQQRRMASLGTVVALTFLRLMLILMIAVLMLQPAVKWTQERTMQGTLWLLLDQSPSMQTTDPQALPAELLRWSEGLGLVKRDQRTDVLQARVHVLLGEMNGMLPDAAVTPADERKAIDAYARRIAAWAKDAEALQKEVDNDPAVGRLRGGQDEYAFAQARRTAEQAAASIRQARSLQSVAGLLPKYEIVEKLGQVERELAQAAAQADGDYRREHGGDAALRDADKQVAALSRNELAHATLTGTDARATRLLAELAKKYRVRIASFSDKVNTAGTVEPRELGETIRTSLLPAGQATNMAGALQGVAEQIAPEEAASIIVVSDGRTNVAGDPAGTARNLASRGVHVYGVLVGSREVSPDAAVEPADFPDWVYQGDKIHARATIRLDGLAGKTAVVQLRRAVGDGSPSAGTLIEPKTVEIKENHETRPFDFTDTPPEGEKAIAYEIRVSEMPGEVNTQNNVATFRVAVKKDKLYALIIEDRPRWEYRYLASFLGRRQGIGLQTILLQPAIINGVAAPLPVMASPDNPHEEAQRLPQTLADWQKFDIIVLGDVPPEVLTPQMQQFLAATVRDKGATLITIAGQHAMPGRFTGTPLAELLPVTAGPQWTQEQIDRHTRNGFRAYSSPLAAGTPLALLDADPTGNSRIWSAMPVWYWHSAYTEIKPAATAVWSMADLRGAEGTIAEANQHALLATMSIGLGHSLYLASDQSWRLRQVGANLHDRFWGQVLNWAVGSDLPAGGKYVRFGTSQAVYEQTQAVVITARVLKDDLTPYTGLSFSAVGRAAGAPGTQPGPARAGVEARFEPMQSPGYYQATLTGLPVGDVEISLKGSEVERLLNSDPTVTLRTLLIKVLPSLNAEKRNMNTDAVMLENVARAGGGFSVDAPYAELLLSRLPKIEHVERTEMQLGFFTDPRSRTTHMAHWAFLAAFALVIAVEWIVRKWAGLV